ncbi:uncharacterized protein LY79DRAFT_192339 [Colletotrichum navitas]|uniref:Uncharacterized protein n=1 Tax=Colletotrichum navitas TaxID=681940 RepID=A0AAD8PZX7_9PEZI|nr:uncharacterized protein LY79DRAFT_192339 [Colletotrichum navitas]KAK1590812.1 hypothetical protein LY79DRAFT_192339 [Colletotrichum navitas]
MARYPYRPYLRTVVLRRVCEDLPRVFGNRSNILPRPHLLCFYSPATLHGDVSTCRSLWTLSLLAAIMPVSGSSLSRYRRTYNMVAPHSQIHNGTSCVACRDKRTSTLSIQNSTDTCADNRTTSWAHGHIQETCHEEKVFVRISSKGAALSHAFHSGGYLSILLSRIDGLRNQSSI